MRRWIDRKIGKPRAVSLCPPFRDDAKRALREIRPRGFVVDAICRLMRLAELGLNHLGVVFAWKGAAFRRAGSSLGGAVGRRRAPVCGA